MVSSEPDNFESQIANDLCVNPYVAVPNQLSPAYGNGADVSKKSSIVLPIVLIILAIVFCLGCIVGVPIVAYIFKRKSEQKDFTDIKAVI